MKPLENLKIAVINHSGNTGKTTICNNFLLPRLENSIVLETVANRMSLIEKWHEDYDTLFNKIHSATNTIIIDVDGNATGNFIRNMIELSSIHEFNYFIIPISPDTAPEKSIFTINELHSLGVQKEQMIVILNHVYFDTNISREFDWLFSFYKDGLFTMNENLIIEESELYDILFKAFFKEEPKRTITDILNDNTDYNALKKDNTKTMDERKEYSRRDSTRMLCDGVNKKLNDTFQHLAAIFQS